MNDRSWQADVLKQAHDQQLESKPQAHARSSSHAHIASDAHVHPSVSSLGIAFALNLTFTLIEVIGGLWTNSIAVLSDAVHDMGDSLSLGAAWYFDRLSRRGRTPSDTYGYRRYSLLGGLITALVLLVGLSFVVWNALARLFAPETVDVPGMMLLALVGIAFNGAAVFRVRKGTSLTERMVSWHLLEDTLGWLAVLLGALAMWLWDLPFIDPLLSMGIAAFVLWNVSRTLRQFLAVLLQRIPEGFDLAGFEAAVRSIPGVVDVRHTHCWSVDGEIHVLTTHVVLAVDASQQTAMEVKAGVRRLLGAKVFEHVTIEVEWAGAGDDRAGHRGAG